MEIQCPHCQRAIELVGAQELKDDYGLGPNSVQYARDHGKFPEPILSFGNRNVFLRDTIDDYVRARTRSRVNGTVEELERLFCALPPDQRAEMRERLATIH